MKSILGLLACAALGGVASAQWSDNFNRPDGPLGTDWTPQTGTWAVANNQGAHTSTGANELAFHNSASAPYDGATVMLDVFAQNLGSQYSAVLIGVGGTDMIQVKIQDQDAAPGFSNIGIYHQSGTSWAPWTGTGTGFAALQAPFNLARMKVFFPNPDTLVVELDTNFDGTADQVYTQNSVLSIAPALGTGFGLAAWGATARFDNWSVAGGPPPPPQAYCTAGTTTNGCTADISASANPSVSGANACLISITDVEGQKSGIVFYGLGSLPQPWCVSGGSSFLCVKSPTARATAQNSGGSVSQCDGTLSLDWNAFQSANPGSLGSPFSAGLKVFVQGWFRDPPACKSTSLSNAVEMTYIP